MITLGGLLKSQRKKIKKTLRSVEIQSGVSNSYLSQLENDKILHPSPSILHKLAKFYSISYAELMMRAGYPIESSIDSQKKETRSRINRDSREERIKLKEIVIDVLSSVEELKSNKEEEKEEEQPLSDLFVTLDGKKFGDQLQDLQEFTIKCVSMTVFNIMSSVFPKLIKMPEFITLVNDAELDHDERNFFDSIKPLFEKIDLEEIYYNKQFFSLEDQRRFIGGFILGLYSYCEVFVDLLIERAFEIPIFGEMYLDYLDKKESKSEKLLFSRAELNRFLEDQARFSMERGKELFLSHVKKNPYNKLITILSVCNVRDILKGIFYELNVKDYLFDFQSFKEKRDRIAHGDPEPSLSLFNSDGLRRKLKEISEGMKASEEIFPDPEREKIAYTLMKMTEDIIKPIHRPLAIIQELIEIVIVLSAIFERFLQFYD